MTMNATHAVVDERDGYTWVRNGAGELMDQAAAEAMASQWNGECKPDKRTYAVYRLVRAS